MASANKKAMSAAAIKKAAATYKRSKKKGKYMILQGKYGKTNAKKILSASKNIGTQSKPQTKSRKKTSSTAVRQSKPPTGGIFDVLKPTEQAPIAGGPDGWNQWASAGLMQQSAANYSRYARPLLVNEEDIVQYRNLKNLISKYPGATRTAVAQYLRNLRSKVPALINKFKYARNEGQLVSDSEQLQIGTLQSQAMAIIDVARSVLTSSFYGSGAVGASNPTPAGYLGVTKSGDEITFSYGNVAGNSVTSTAIESGTYATVGEAKALLENISHMVSSNSALVGAIVGTAASRYMGVNDSLSRAQNQSLRANWRTAQDTSQELIARAQIAQSLNTVWYDIDNLFNTGVIDKKNKDRLMREWNSIRKQADQLPSDSDLLRDVGGMINNRSSKESLREARYNYNIIAQRLTHLQSIVSNAQEAKTWVETLKAEDRSVAWVKATLTEMVTTIKQMNKLSKGQVENIQKAGTQAERQASGALVTAAQYKAAKNSLSMAEDALATVKRTSSKQEAQTTLAYLFSNADWFVGLEIAGQLAATASAVSFERVAAQQNSAWELANSGAHRYQQVVDFGLADATNFQKLTAEQMPDDKKLKVGNALMASQGLMGGKALAKPNIVMVPSEPNPANLKALLPAGVRGLSSLHAEARARAAAQYLAELMGKEKRFLGIISNNPALAYGGPQAEQVKQQAKLLKETLSGIKYDKTMTNAGINASNGNLILAAFRSVELQRPQICHHFSRRSHALSCLSRKHPLCEPW